MINTAQRTLASPHNNSAGACSTLIESGRCLIRRYRTTTSNKKEHTRVPAIHQLSVKCNPPHRSRGNIINETQSPMLPPGNLRRPQSVYFCNPGYRSTMFSPMSSPKYFSRALRRQPGPVAKFSIFANSSLLRRMVVTDGAMPLVLMLMILTPTYADK